MPGYHFAQRRARVPRSESFLSPPYAAVMSPVAFLLKPADSQLRDGTGQRGPVQCTVSSFETRPKGTLRFSLHFAWQRGCLVSEWSWQEKRKRALLESNPPGISCRRLIPMSAGEVALVAASPVFWALGVIGAGLSTSSKPHRDRSPDAFENSTPRAARPVRVLPRSRFAVVRTPPASNSPRPHAVGPGCNSAR